MSLLLRTLALARSVCSRGLATPPARRSISTSPSTSTLRSSYGFLCAAAFGVVATSAALSRTVHLDSNEKDSRAEQTVVDPATSIAFPTTISVPSKIQIPSLSLVGVGVRTVSFLRMNVYSVGFYADLNDPNLKVSKDMTAEEKIQHIVRNTACVIRIVPTRSTSYTHLRDAFLRALHGRLAIAKKNGTITEEEEHAAASPMRKLKSIFPNAPLAKHTPLDVFLSPPHPNRPRALVFRDMGSVENDWVATEFVLHYFEGNGPSPALKKSVLEHLQDFEK